METNVSALDTNAKHLVKLGARAVWFIVGLMSFVVVVLGISTALLLLVVVNNQTRLQEEIQLSQEAKCTYYYIDGSAPLSAHPFPTKHTVLVTLAARAYYNGLQCTKPLPKPGAVLVKAGKRYHINVYKDG